jgi:MFS family permease
MSGGLMAPMAQLMVARTAGKHLMRVVGYVAVPVLPGPIVGPVIAGAILQHASWHWLFLINLPIGVLAVILAVMTSVRILTISIQSKGRGFVFAAFFKASIASRPTSDLPDTSRSATTHSSTTTQPSWGALSWRHL